MSVQIATVHILTNQVDVGHRSTPTMSDFQNFRSGSGQSFLKRSASEWNFSCTGWIRTETVDSNPLEKAGRTQLIEGGRFSALATADY